MTKYLIMMILIASAFTSAWSLSIYDIQYTTFPGSDNTYPSLYAGKSVSTEGIVTAVDYKYGGFFISEVLAGPYSGILVVDRRSDIQVGDLIRLTGVVQESFGMTALQDISALSILERKHPLPRPVNLTTAQLSHAVEAEAYEGVYARIQGAGSTGRKSSANRIMVSDGTSPCSVILGSFAGFNYKAAAKSNAQYSSITGIVTFSFGEFSLNPVNNSDIEVNQPVSVQNRSWGKIKSIYK